MTRLENRLSRKELFDIGEAFIDDFIAGLAGNVKLKRISANWLDTAIASYEATGEEVRIFHSFMYKAGSWNHQQRVVAKIEVNIF